MCLKKGEVRARLYCTAPFFIMILHMNRIIGFPASWQYRHAISVVVTEIKELRKRMVIFHAKRKHLIYSYTSLCHLSIYDSKL